VSAGKRTCYHARMLLFHGTRAKALDEILAHGLKPPSPGDSGHDWVWDLSGRSQRASIFLSTEPVAGKGGDPVSFAMGWPVKGLRTREAGYMVVVDLPPEALHLIAGVVPNLDLDIAVGISHARSMLRRTFLVEARSVGQEVEAPLATWILSHWCLHYWLSRYCADHHIALDSSALDKIFAIQGATTYSSLPADMTLEQWRAFLDDYFRVVDFAYIDHVPEAQAERRRKSVLRKYGVTLPDDIEADDHSRSCRLCMAGLFQYTYRIDGFFEYAPFRSFLSSMPKKSGYQRLPEDIVLNSYVMSVETKNGGLGTPQSLTQRLRAVAAHTAPYDEESVSRFFHERESSAYLRREPSWTWEDWYKAFPAEKCDLPKEWRPGVFRRFSAADLKLPDRQVIAAAIPCEYVIGAIKISDGARFLPHIRPNRRSGETLSSKLWRLALQIRSQYAGSPVVID
jgi:hypothetical protein